MPSCHMSTGLRGALGLWGFKERFGRSTLTRTVLCVAFADRGPDLRIAELQIVLKFVYVHDAGDRNPVLFENEAFLVDVGSTDKLAEIDPRLRNGDAVYHMPFLINVD